MENLTSTAERLTARPQYTMMWQWLRGGAGLRVHRIKNHPPVPRHDHVFHELVLIESGAADHETADGLRPLRPGDLIILRPLTWHAYHEPQKLCLINCLIDAPLMQRLSALLEHIPQAFDLFRKRSSAPQDALPTLLHASPAQSQAMRVHLDAIIAEQHTESRGWQAAAMAALLQFLVAAARLSDNAMPEAPLEPTNQTSRAIFDTVAYLERHFTEPITLQELAERVHLSPPHLSRRFSQQMGLGIIQYLHRLRAEEACRLLRCTSLPITEIAQRLGYEEIAYFSRCFRSQIKQSPRQWRAVGPAKGMTSPDEQQNQIVPG